MSKVFNYTPNFCKCGKEPILVQWTDTLKPNATWIECECGLITRSFHHKDSLFAKRKAITMWNKKAKTRRKIKSGLRSCEKCSSNEVKIEEIRFKTFTAVLVGCDSCGLMVDEMFGEEMVTKDMAMAIWNK